MTWAGAGFFGGLLLGLSYKAAIMLGAILIVSGPTVVTPILHAARTGKKVTTILGFEGTTIDPIGAIIAVVVFQAITASRAHHEVLSAPLVALHIGGADKLLPATFLVIVGTVAIYGLAAAPLARALGLRQAETEKNPGEQPPLNPLGTDGGPVGPSAATRAG